MRRWVLAFALMGCGDVNKLTDAGLADADQSDAGRICAAGEMLCNGATCTDTMTDEFNCGGCNNQCTPLQQCEAGSCTPISTCKQVRELNPMAVDGAYGTPTGALYCDFTNNVEYSALGLGVHNQTYPDYALIRSTDLNDPLFQKAFIAVFNGQGGLLNIAPGQSPLNCCLKSADAGAGQMLVFNTTQFLYPANATVNAQVCGGPYNDAKYRFFINGSGEYAPLPMPASFFATHPASVSTQCNDGNNPGIFVKKKPAL